MQLNVLQFLFIGFMLNHADDVSAKEKVHIKIVVPEFVKHEHHTKIVFIKKKSGHHEHKKKPHVVVHKHDHSHKHKHNHGHKHGHKHDAKHGHKHEHKGHHKHTHFVKKVHGHHHHKKHGHHHFEPLLDDFHSRSVQSHRTEHFNHESVEDPSLPKPYMARGNYKVSEKSPEDFSVQNYQQQYQYPPNDATFGSLFQQHKSRDHDKYHAVSAEDEDDKLPENEYQELATLNEPQNYLDYEYNAPVESENFESVNYDYNGGADSRQNKLYRVPPKGFKGALLDQYRGFSVAASELHEQKVPCL